MTKFSPQNDANFVSAAQLDQLHLLQLLCLTCCIVSPFKLEKCFIPIEQESSIFYTQHIMFVIVGKKEERKHRLWCKFSTSLFLILFHQTAIA